MEKLYGRGMAMARICTTTRIRWDVEASTDQNGSSTVLAKTHTWPSSSDGQWESVASSRVSFLLVEPGGGRKREEGDAIGGLSEEDRCSVRFELGPAPISLKSRGRQWAEREAAGESGGRKGGERRRRKRELDLRRGRSPQSREGRKRRGGDEKGMVQGVEARLRAGEGSAESSGGFRDVIARQGDSATAAGRDGGSSTSASSIWRPEDEEHWRKVVGMQGGSKAARRVRGAAAGNRYANISRATSELRAVFDEIDEDGDGWVTEGELKAYAEKKSLPTAYVREFLELAQRRGRTWAWPWERITPCFVDSDGSAGPGEGGLAALRSGGGLPALVRMMLATASRRTKTWDGDRGGDHVAQSDTSFRNWMGGVVGTAAHRLGLVADPDEGGGSMHRLKAMSRPPPGGRSVDFAAFKDFVESKDEALRESFRRIDEDGDGFITLEELQDKIQNVRVMDAESGSYKPVKRGCVANMVQRAGADQQDTLSYEEFRRFFTLLPTSEYLLNYWVDASCFRGAVDVGSNFQGVGDNAVLLGAYKSSPLEKGSALSHLLAGGLAGALSRTFTAPLETIRLQMMITSSESMAEASREIIASCGGWTGFFKGNLTNVVRATPQKAIDFFSFEAYKKYLHRVGIRAPQLQMLTAGAMAGATSTTILYPLDVVRSRLTVQNCGQYKGILDALIKIPQQEGFFALYRGLGSSVIAIMPEAAICYGAFDILKRVYQNVTKKEEVELLPALACGATSAFLGQLVSFPLELVTRRMQTGAEYKNLVHALTSISSGGVCNLYKGIIPASLKVIPMAIVSFGTYEMGRSTLAKIAERERRRKMEKDALEDERRHRLVLVNLKADSGAAPRMHGS